MYIVINSSIIVNDVLYNTNNRYSFDANITFSSLAIERKNSLLSECFRGDTDLLDDEVNASTLSG